VAASKRQRRLARAKYERQSARRAQSADRRARRQRIIAVVVVAALVVGSVGWVVYSATSGGTTDTAAGAQSPDLTTELLPTADGASAPAASAPADAAARLAAAGLDCRAAGTPRPDNVTYGSAPAPDATSAAAKAITLVTNCGDIVIAVDPAAPATVASEVRLATDGFYANTACHRLTTEGIFVLQCGDPAGKGSGGPGYTVPDENLPTAGADGTAVYPAGTVAMANAGPGTSGSQFFVVYDDSPLPPNYTVWGTVTTGLDLVRQIAAAGTLDGGPDGAPLQPVFIESASVQPA